MVYPLVPLLHIIPVLCAMKLLTGIYILTFWPLDSSFGCIQGRLFSKLAKQFSESQISFIFQDIHSRYISSWSGENFLATWCLLQNYSQPLFSGSHPKVLAQLLRSPGLTIH